MEPITITLHVPDSIQRLMAEAPERPPGGITPADIQQYVAGLVVAAAFMMGPTGREVAAEFRLLNED